MTTSSTEASLRSLLTQLEQELRLSRELRQVMLLKQQALVANDLPSIQPLAERELALAARFAAAERQRLDALGAVARAMGLDLAALGVRELLRRLHGHPLCESIEKTASELRLLMFELQLINGDNRHLTENLLEYTDLVIRLVARAAGNACYGRDGQFSSAPALRALVDDRI